MTNAIELRDLRKKYETFTLDGVSLTLPMGCIMGFNRGERRREEHHHQGHAGAHRKGQR